MNFIQDIFPKVSVIITAYSGNAKYLKEAVSSVTVQDYPHIEIIVMSSPCMEPAQAKKIITGGFKVDAATAGIKYATATKPGPSAARNEGMKIATGDLILYLDADDRISNQFIKKCWLTMWDCVDIVATGWNYFGFSEKMVPIPEKITYETLKTGNKMVISCLFRREIWHKIGGFDEFMSSGFEDWDFWLRATKAGFNVRTTENAHFYYRKHEFSHNKTAFQNAFHIKNYIKAKGLI